MPTSKERMMHIYKLLPLSYCERQTTRQASAVAYTPVFMSSVLRELSTTGMSLCVLMWNFEHLDS